MKAINKALRVLIAYNSLFYFAASLFGTLYAVFIQKIGGGVMLISVSTAVFYISSTLFLLVMAKFGDKVKEKELLLAGSYLLRAVGYACYLVVGSALGLILLQVLFGLADAMGTPTFSALFAKHIDSKIEVMEYSDWTIIANLTMALGAVLGGFLVSAYGFSMLFVVMTLLCLGSFVGILLTPRRVI